LSITICTQYNLNVIFLVDIFKNDFIEYPKTSKDHVWKPGIVIMNNNLICVVGNDGESGNSDYNPFGVIEGFDIRENKWFEMDELNTIFEINEKSDNKRYFQCFINGA